MKKYCFGIDVGGTTIKCGLFSTESEELLEKWEIPTRTEKNGVNILPDIAATVLSKLKDLGIKKSEVEGIGVDIPGPVNDKGEVAMAVNLHWGHVDIVGRMTELTGIPAKALNDANAAALGECWKGGGTGFQNMIMVTLGTGIGGGVILNGKVLSGVHGAGGEIGHIHVTDELTEPCNCGNVGCLEQVASATGIVLLAKKELEKDKELPTPLRSVTPLTAKAVWDAVKDGDEMADRIAERFGYFLGRALAGIVAVADPEVIVIGGGVSKAGEIILEYVQKYYRQFAFPACKEVIFTLATLGNDAGIYGAAKEVL